ncbi:MAG: hypothetical protein JWN17_2245 [Frankiales bacterium]|nr:hypothetical protein [Frankiales bacterium]
MTTTTETGPAPAVIDLRDRPATTRPDPVARPAACTAAGTAAAPARALRRARLARLQAADVRESALLHARLTGRRR